MSNTVRRRKSHNAWNRGRDRYMVELADKPPAPVRPLRKPKPQSERDALVTDHAVLRWLERVTGIDVARQVRDEILAAGREELIRTVGRGKIRIADTAVVLQVVAGRVVTVKVEGHG